MTGKDRKGKGPGCRDREARLRAPAVIAVDMIPLLPGGDNGGAKLLALELVRGLSAIAPDWQFVLLTSARGHEELAALDSENVRRLCVFGQQEPAADTASTGAETRVRALISMLAHCLPSPIKLKLASIYERVVSSLKPDSLLTRIGADLLFCPFVLPFFHDRKVPTVSIVHDLQYHYYPMFFTPEDRYSRERNFRTTCRRADRIVCISEYARGTVLENSDFEEDAVTTIHIQLPHRLKKPSADIASTVLNRFGLVENEFLLYPANFWPHKNHRMLLTAFGIYCARRPESGICLVCTGALDEEKRKIHAAVDRMGLGERVIFTGYLSDEEFSVIFASCLALIFPSLYEGYGMPVVEAMAFGKPVLCSDVTSLPEVAGDAALYFDPRKPRDIAHAIERITTESGLGENLVSRGYQRLNDSGSPEKMARQYLDVFLDLMCDPHNTRGTTRRRV